MNALSTLASRVTSTMQLGPSRQRWSALPRTARLTVLALLGWCLLVVFGTLASIATIQMLASPTTRPAVAAPSARSMPMATTEVILQRPLFARSRQPVVAVAAPLRQPPPPPLSPISTRDAGVTLSGVFMSGTQTKAFLTTSQNPAGMWLAPDAVIGGWRLVAVRAGEVELEGGGARVIVPYTAGAGRR